MLRCTEEACILMDAKLRVNVIFLSRFSQFWSYYRTNRLRLPVLKLNTRLKIQDVRQQGTFTLKMRPEYHQNRRSQWRHPALTQRAVITCIVLYAIITPHNRLLWEEEATLRLRLATIEPQLKRGMWPSAAQVKRFPRYTQNTRRHVSHPRSNIFDGLMAEPCPKASSCSRFKHINRLICAPCARTSRWKSG